MSRGSSATFDDVLGLVKKWGLLMLQDKTLPSLVGLIAGEPVSGSWWGHPRGHQMFEIAGELDDHPDVMTTKLVSGKVTFTHRDLWADVIAVGCARDDWQMARLSEDALELLNEVDARGCVQTSGKRAKQLEQRLLVASHQVHTESGAHALELLTWKQFARANGLAFPRTSPGPARARLEQLVDRMNADCGGNGNLPWPRSG